MKHHHRYLPLISTGLIALLLNGCSANSPSDAHFKTAIETALTNNTYSGNCIRVVLEDRSNQDYQKDTLLQTLVNQGYVKATKVSTISSDVWGMPGEHTPGYKLALTDTGKKAFKDDYFCFGNVVVTKIDNYTLATVPFSGEKGAAVKYTYQIENKPAWISSNLVTSDGLGIHALQLNLNPQTAEMDLIQGAKGWYHQGMI